MSAERVTVRAGFGNPSTPNVKVPGWLVSGPTGRIFFEHESAARRAADRMRAGDTEVGFDLADFEPVEPTLKSTGRRADDAS